MHPFRLPKQFILLVSACDHYRDQIYTLVGDIKKAKIPDEQVFFVNAQASDNLMWRTKRIRVANMKDSCLHLSGLLYVLRHQKYFDPRSVFFLVPCTVRLYADFIQRIAPFVRAFKNSRHLCQPCLSPAITQTMDIGFFTLAHIQNLAPFMTKRVCKSPLRDQQLIRMKRRMVCDENKIFGIPGWVSHREDGRWIEKEGWKDRNFCGQYSPRLRTNECLELPDPHVPAMINEPDDINVSYFQNADGVEFKVTSIRRLGFKKLQRNFRGVGNIILGKKDT